MKTLKTMKFKRLAIVVAIVSIGLFSTGLNFSKIQATCESSQSKCGDACEKALKCIKDGKQNCLKAIPKECKCVTPQ